MQYRGFPSYYENFLVCNYGPSANIYKQPVYDIANNTCNCPCIGCNPETGMCPLNCEFSELMRLTILKNIFKGFSSAADARTNSTVDQPSVKLMYKIINTFTKLILFNSCS